MQASNRFSDVDLTSGTLSKVDDVGGRSVQAVSGELITRVLSFTEAGDLTFGHMRVIM